MLPKFNSNQSNYDAKGVMFQCEKCDYNTNFKAKIERHYRAVHDDSENKKGTS